MMNPEHLIPKELRLPAYQRKLLGVFEKAGPGKELTTSKAGEKLGYSQHYIRGYLHQRLKILEGRGFLVRRMDRGGNRAWWSQGPMCDALKERGLMK